MSRRPARITKTEAAGIIVAAKEAGACEVVIKFGDQSVAVVRLSTPTDKTIEAAGEVIL
jgi:hypothetical protein